MEKGVCELMKRGDHHVKFICKTLLITYLLKEKEKEPNLQSIKNQVSETDYNEVLESLSLDKIPTFNEKTLRFTFKQKPPNSRNVRI